MKPYSCVQNRARKPDPTDPRYVLRREVDLGVCPQTFNGITGRRLRGVEVFAMQINHVQGNTASPLNAYVRAEDIQEIRIAAHVIKLSSPLLFFQAQVHIVATKLSMDDGTIATNPKAHAKATDPGAAALPGSNAGGVTVVCRDLIGRPWPSVLASGSPGQSLARQRNRDDRMKLIPCDFNDPAKGPSSLVSFPNLEARTSLGVCMTPPMDKALGWMFWPSLLKGRQADEVMGWAGQVTYVQASFEPELRNWVPGLPKVNDYWEAGSPHGPWEDDKFGYGAPARGGDGGSLRSNQKEILESAEHFCGAGSQSSPEEEPCQVPARAVHLHLQLKSPDLALGSLGTLAATAATFSKNPPEAPYCAAAGKGGVKELLPPDTLTTTPEVLDLAMLYAKDLYLAGYPQDAREVLESLDFRGMGDPGSQALAIEAKVLLERLDSNLDYYGFPLNWVPLLSVDTNLAIFQAEIERSLDLLYLAHVIDTRWEKYEEQVKIVESAQRQARQLADAAKVSLRETWGKIGELSGAMSDMEAQSQEFKGKLEALRSELLSKAKDEVQRKMAWEKFSSIFKIFATVASAVPVGAPYTTMVSQTLDMVSDLAVRVSDNSVDWGDSLVTVFEKTHGVLKEGLADPALAEKLRQRLLSPSTEVDAAKEKIREIDEKLSKFEPDEKDEKEQLQKERSAHQSIVNAVEERGAAAAAQFNTSCESLTKIFKTTNTEVKKLMVSADEADKKIAEELKKLEADSEPFKELRKSLNELTAKRALVATTLLDMETQVGKLVASLTNNLLNLDTLFREKGKRADLLNPNVSQIANRLRQQASEGLNKYQYYLKKSFEYNFLEAAPYDFGIASLQAQIVTFLQEGSDSRELSPERMRSLGAVYQESLGKLGGMIVDSLQTSNGRFITRLVVNLDPQALAALGRHGAVSLDLDARLPVLTEDVRIRNISVDKIATGSGTPPDNLDLRIWHSGTSRLERGRHLYQFLSTSPRMWGIHHEPSTGKTTPIEPADQVDVNLIESLFGATSRDKTNQLGRYNPAFSGPLDLQLMADSRSDELVSALSLKIEYEYRPVR